MLTALTLTALTLTTRLGSGLAAPPQPAAIPSALEQQFSPTPVAQFWRRRNPAEEERKRTQIVTVTAAQLVTEDIVGTAYYTIRGTLVNRTPGAVSNILVYYEVVSPSATPDSFRVVDAGTIRVPASLGVGGQTEFSAIPKAAGQLRITLIEWLNADRSYGSFSQRQVFP
jgi:hypothetical protein